MTLHRIRTPSLTLAAVVAFAANSVLARLALSGGGIDALGFTGIRMVSGAAILIAACQLRSDRGTPLAVLRSGNLIQSGALFVYAVTASLSYALLGAGVGALVLFGTVQLTTVGRAIALGERPGALVWLGLAIAFASLAYLVSPSIAAPDSVGVALSVASGIGWAVYSLAGHRTGSPLMDTTGNFLRLVPATAALALIGLAIHPPSFDALLVAVLCGALSTGIGYAVWYAVLPSLARVQASIVQLTVPAIAALGAVPILGEPLTLHFVISAVAILGGVGLAILGRRRKRGAIQ